MFNTCLSKWNWKREFFNYRHQQIGDNNCIRYTFCTGSKKAEQTSQNTNNDSINDLTVSGNWAGNIIGCHKESSKNQPTTT